ncbi:MAG: hypothetical protein AAF938_16260 [Myxococcota bacterium]
MPVQTIVMLLVVGALVVFSIVWNKVRLARAKEAFADAVAGALAEKMGLEVIKGDPFANLMLVAHENAQKGDNEASEMLLEGTPGGRFTRVAYYHRRKVDAHFASSTITTWVGAEISVQVHASFPEFEVVLKNPKGYAGELKPKLAAPPHVTGHRSVDARIGVKSLHPEVARVLGPALEPAAGWGWVHIHGEAEKLTFHATKRTLGYLGIADQIQQLLIGMAVALEKAGGQA